MIKPLVRFFNKEGLLTDSSILFAGLTGAQIFNLLFQMFMGRHLRAEEFALLISLLGVFNMLSFPLGVFSTAINRYASLLISDGRAGDVRKLVVYWCGRMCLAGGGLSVVCLVFPASIANFFHLERLAPVRVFGWILTGVFCAPIVNGALLGTQRFWAWCVGTVLGASARLLVGALLVAFISPFAGWGLLGHGIGFYMMVVFGGVVLSFTLKGTEASTQPLPRLQGYLPGSFCIMLGYAVLMTADVVLVKHLLPESAGDFAYAAILGRLVLFVPQSLVAAMFPKVVAARQGTQKQKSLLWKTLLAACMAATATALVFTLLARPLPQLLFGIAEPSADLVRWLRMLSWIMVPVAMLSVAMRYALAQNRLAAATIIPLSAIGYLAASFVVAKSPTAILCALAAMSTLSLLVLCFFLLTSHIPRESVA